MKEGECLIQENRMPNNLCVPVLQVFQERQPREPGLQNLFQLVQGLGLIPVFCPETNGILFPEHLVLLATTLFPLKGILLTLFGMKNQHPLRILLNHWALDLLVYCRRFFKPTKIDFYCFMYLGKSWQDKVKDVISAMEEKNSSIILFTALDDIACNIDFF